MLRNQSFLKVVNKKLTFTSKKQLSKQRRSFTQDSITQKKITKMLTFVVLTALAVGANGRPSNNQCEATLEMIRAINKTYMVDYEKAGELIMSQEKMNHQWAVHEVKTPTCPPNPDNCEVQCLYGWDLSENLLVSVLIQISKDPECESQWHAVHVRITSCGANSKPQMMYLPIQVFKTIQIDPQE